MNFPAFFGINDIKNLIVKKYNQDLLDIRQWWNDHDSGARQWTQISTLGFTTQTVSKATAYAATLGDTIILVDSTAAVRTITLPTAVGITGKWYLIKDWKGQAATHNITIATTSAQTIDGGASKVLTQNYLGYLVVSDGANWSIMADEESLIFVGFQAPVQVTTETSTTTTSSTYQSTNLTASITPTSSSHRIKISVSGSMQIASGVGIEAYITLFRGVTDVGGAGNLGFNVIRSQAANAVRGVVSFNYIDSPGSSSSVTYTVKIKNSDNATTLTGLPTGVSEKCVIILEEVV